MNISFGLGVSIGNVCTNTICAVAQNILYLINNVLVPVLFAIAFIVFLYGIAKAYIFSAGDPEAVKQGHKLLMWGIIAFVVMISIWGLVNVVANTFGLAGYYAPPTPSSISPYGSAVPMGGAYGGSYGQPSQPSSNERVVGQCVNEVSNNVTCQCPNGSVVSNRASCP